MLTMQYPLNHTQDCFVTEITALISIQMPSELFVPRYLTAMSTTD